MDKLPLPISDLTVFAVLLISALFATIRGFTHEILSISSWLAAVLAVMFGLPYARPFARQYIPTDWMADAAAAAAIFFIVLIAAAFLTRSISRGVHDSALSPVDRALGFVFGAIRGALIVVLGYIGMTWVLDVSRPPTWMQDGKTTPWIVAGADKIKEITPEDLLEADLTKSAEQSKRAAQDAIAIEKTLRAWSAPSPEKPEKNEQPKGYADDQRRDMNRLIDANQ